MQYGKPRLQGRVGSIACLHRRALARESPEERETRWRANADAMRETRARESREEVETRRRANADAMSEAQARRIADRGWSHICPLAFRKYCCSRLNVHTKVAEASEATYNNTCYHRQGCQKLGFCPNTRISDVSKGNSDGFG